MTTKEAAVILAVSVGRIKHLIANGTLTATSKPRVGQGGNEWHIDPVTVAAYATSERKPGRRQKVAITISTDRALAFVQSEEGKIAIAKSQDRAEETARKLRKALGRPRI